jgi:hypothetical protein
LPFETSNQASACLLSSIIHFAKKFLLPSRQGIVREPILDFLIQVVLWLRNGSVEFLLIPIPKSPVDI